MIILITGYFPIYDYLGYPTGKKEFVVSHGIDEETGKSIVLPNEHPNALGGEFNSELGEWVIYE